MRLFLLVTSMSLSILPISAIAQFGVRPGQSATSLNGRPSVSENKHIFKVTVPTPNAEFESYTAVAPLQTGVCKLWGVGRDHDNDAYGTSVRAAYTRLKELLDEKYGVGNEFDFIKSGALWDKPNEWVMSINQNERNLTTYWTRSNGNTLPDNIEAISLDVNAYSRDASYVDLTYEFSNFTQCKAYMQKDAAKGL